MGLGFGKAALGVNSGDCRSILLKLKVWRAL